MVRAPRRPAEAAPPPDFTPAGNGSNRAGPYTKARGSHNSGRPRRGPPLCGKPSHASSLVVPAKAGIHPSDVRVAEPWIPAFAGMTNLVALPKWE
jgi:hypothetical protein